MATLNNADAYGPHALHQSHFRILTRILSHSTYPSIVHLYQAGTPEMQRGGRLCKLHPFPAVNQRRVSSDPVLFAKSFSDSTPHTHRKMSDIPLLGGLRGLQSVAFCALEEEEEKPGLLGADQPVAQEEPVPHPQHNAQSQTPFEGSNAPGLESVGGNENAGVQSGFMSASMEDTSSLSMADEDGHGSATCSTPHFSHLSSAASDSCSGNLIAW